MKLYYYDDENRIAFFEIADKLVFPCSVNVTTGSGHVIGTPAESLEIADDLPTVLQAVVDKYADDKNDTEISGVNDSLSACDYVNARMRAKWSGHVTETTDTDVFTLSLSSRPVENDLLSDDFVGTLFKGDVAFLLDYGHRVAKAESNVSGNRWKTAIKAFFAGYTGDELRATVKDGFKFPDTVTLWKDYSVTKERMEFLRGCYPTTHALTKDTFGTRADKRRFVNVLLSTDTILAAKKAAQKKA